jgi:hypothetical protein
MFESRGIVAHVVRGAIGLSALAGALAMASTHPVLSAAAVVVGVIALRGCPMCWTLGLMQTVAAKIRGTRTDKPCAKDQCSLDQRGASSILEREMAGSRARSSGVKPPGCVPGAPARAPTPPVSQKSQMIPRCPTVVSRRCYQVGLRTLRMPIALSDSKRSQSAIRGGIAATINGRAWPTPDLAVDGPE